MITSRRVLLHLGVLLLIILCSSCSSPNPHPIKNSLFNPSDTGILVVSVKNGCSLFNPTRNTKYSIRSKDRKVDFMAVYDTATSKEYVIDCALVDFFNIPAGEYEIYSWTSLKMTFSSGWREKPKNEFSIPFRVEADKINYLGQILLDLDYSISFSDMKNRDIDTFYSRYPSSKDLMVVEPISYNYKRINDDDIEIIGKSQNIYTPAPMIKGK